MALIIIFTILVVLFIAWTTLEKWWKNLPPGPMAFPLVGNSIHLRWCKDPGFMVMHRWSREKYGPVITVYLGNIRTVVLNSVNVVNEALVNKASDYSGRPGLYSFEVLSQGFQNIQFTSESETWRRHKRSGACALRHVMKRNMFESTIQQSVDKCGREMSKETRPFDPLPYINKMWFLIVDAMCFGSVKNWADPKVECLVKTLHEIIDEFGNGFMEDVVPLLKKYPSVSFRKFQEGIHVYLDYFQQQIDSHRTNIVKDSPKDVLDSLILSQNDSENVMNIANGHHATLSDTHISMIVGDIFSADYDTSRSTFLWFLLFMVGHPNIQEKIQSEIDVVTGNRMPKLSDRPKLVYTEATMYETFRLAISSPVGLPHSTQRNTTVGGYHVPKGTMVLVNLWSLHNDPDYWESPEKFRPERFIEVDGTLKNKGLKSWYPFSAGKRSCLGDFVAKPQFLLTMACLLKQYKFSLRPGDLVDYSSKDNSIFVYVPKPFKVVVERRN